MQATHDVINTVHVHEREAFEPEKWVARVAGEITRGQWEERRGEHEILEVRYVLQEGEQGALGSNGCAGETVKVDLPDVDRIPVQVWKGVDLRESQ